MIACRHSSALSRHCTRVDMDTIGLDEELRLNEALITEDRVKCACTVISPSVGNWTVESCWCAFNSDSNKRLVEATERLLCVRSSPHAFTTRESMSESGDSNNTVDRERKSKVCREACSKSVLSSLLTVAGLSTRATSGLKSTSPGEAIQRADDSLWNRLRA